MVAMVVNGKGKEEDMVQVQTNEHSSFGEF